MSDFRIAYDLSRTRFELEVQGLGQAQLAWRPFTGSLSIGQMVLHVVGVEVKFTTRLIGLPARPGDDRLVLAATQGVVDDQPFPFPDDELKPGFIGAALARGRDAVTALFEADSPDIRAKELVSVLGPMITGEGAMARLALHPFYHQGQAFLVKGAPGFPS